MPRPGVTKISIRLLITKENGEVVLSPSPKPQCDQEYFSFLIREKDLKPLMEGSPKENLFHYFAQQYNRAFMEFLMLELNVDSVYLASIYVDDYDVEFSYVESEFMCDTYLSGSIHAEYSENIGMLSDFDYYPYGLVDYKLVSSKKT